MVKVAVCDDEKNIVADLELALADVFDGLGVGREIDGFFSGDDLLRALEAGARYDLIFLDIGFAENEISGVEVGRLIRGAYNDDDVSIVYVSWEKTRAVELFEIRPMDFLIKPLTREKIKETVETFLRISARGAGEFAYVENHVTRVARIKDVVYLEARDRKITVHFRDGGKSDFYGALKDVYEGQLKGRDFLFVHASYVVNYDYVTTVKYDGLSVKGVPTPLPISRNRKNEVRDRLAAIMKRRVQ